jgi:molybdate transport system regulatory protein
MTVVPPVPALSVPSDGPGFPRVTIRIDLAEGVRIGPGKVALLEAIARTGSISAAGRAMRMSYRRAWDLVEEMNRTLGPPVVTAAAGGMGGGGARLTPHGAALAACYRRLEATARTAAADCLALLEGPRAAEAAQI